MIIKIFIVLLILVGLTYACFLTRIKGNTNSKFISVSTANLVLEYSDGNGVLEPASTIKPGDDVSFFDGQGNTIGEKTFTVENKGNDKVEGYVVTLENVTVKYANNGTIIVDEEEVPVTAGQSTSFKRPQDLVYTITCISKNATTGVVSGTCDGLEETQFPNPTNVAIILSNDIEVGIRHEYSMTIRYKEAGVNQSDDMNKTFTAKININDVGAINPYVIQ